MPLKGTDAISLTDFVNDLTWNEIHLFWLGLYAGFVAIRPTARAEPKQAYRGLNWSVNQWYWKVGYILGYLLKAAVVAYLGASNPDSITALLPV